MNGLRAVVVCLVIVCATLVSPAAAVTPSWSALPVPAAAPPVTVSDLAARGPGEAWATGYEHATDGLRPMLYRWDGRAWSRDTTFPGAGELGWLGKVQFVGEEVWIFHNRVGLGEILRRSAGGGWSAVPLPQTLWVHQDFAAVAGAAWVVGEDDTGLKVLRYDGSGWTTQSTPDGVLYLMGITARTAADAWAWADTSTGTTVLRWDGTVWRDAKVPLPSNANVHTVILERSGRVTIGGSQYTDGVARTYLMTWNGHAWRTTHPPLGDTHTEAMVRGPDGTLWLPVRSDRAFQSKYARVDGSRTAFSYGPERTNAIDVKPRALAKAGSALLSFGTVEIYGSGPNLMSERLGG
ncbi:hypothetical protein [Streptomyces resistomycificus]|uniref:Secreted protein n=1 Tax=Streptomyces resistomycificus TaxID=67356 RepID=A0A0L8LGP5_9ACTN|nr:hypothetical protein [Streptomyces resistomycificus]KOG37290.1 hypothetical protein ADK37_12645 [Streptomyces resistomycificus]KUN95250.1 hypothetical protein AQJ84_24365 [Streptomyces resistomycificus]